MIDSPSIGGFSTDQRTGLVFRAAGVCRAGASDQRQPQRSRTGRAWRALRERDVVAGALGIDVQRFKLMAFVVSATMTAIAGALFAYFRNFVSIDAFSLYLTVQYRGDDHHRRNGLDSPARCSAPRFVILFPYAIEAIAGVLAGAFRQHRVRGRLRRVRRGDDPVPAARARPA